MDPWKMESILRDRISPYLLSTTPSVLFPFLSLYHCEEDKGCISSLAGLYGDLEPTMDYDLEEIRDLLFTEFENRTFTEEQAALICGLSTEPLEELLEEGYLEIVPDGLRIPGDQSENE